MNTYFIVLYATKSEETKEVLYFLKTVGKVKSFTEDDFPAWFIKTDLMTNTLSDEIYNRTFKADRFAIINLDKASENEFHILTEKLNWLPLP